MSIRLMHLADLHLGAPLSYLGDKAGQRSRELEEALMRALALIPEKNVHVVAIAGDLFDSPTPPLELVARVKAAFKKVTDGGVPIVLITGTHDNHRYSRCVYKSNEFAGTDILFGAGERIRKNINGHDVFFYGYSGGRDKGDNVAAFRRGEGDGLHIALVHGTVNEGTHWAPSPRDYSLRPDEIEKSGFHYVALGHHHNFREFRLGTTPAVYPGTLEGRKFGENGDRHVVIAEIGEHGVTLEKIKHNQRTLSEIQIDLTQQGIASAGELTKAIEKYADPNSIVKVALTGTADFIPSKDEIEALLSDRFFHLEITDDTSLFQSEMVQSIKNEKTVRGIFTRTMLEKIAQSSDEDRETAELALRLGVEQFMQLLRLTDEDN